MHIAHHLTREIGKCEKRKGDKAKKFLNRAELLRKEVLLLKVLNQLCHIILFHCIVTFQYQ